MALGGKKEPPQKVTVLRLISPAWAAAEALESCKAAPVLHHSFAPGMDCLDEAAVHHQTFAVSLLSISFVTG